MITFYMSNTKPDVIATAEGNHLNIYFDFELVEDDMYRCRYVHLQNREYKRILSALIAEKYSYDEAEDILFDAFSEPAEEYAKYQEWRNHCKQVAKKAWELITEQQQ